MRVWGGELQSPLRHHRNPWSGRLGSWGVGGGTIWGGAATWCLPARQSHVSSEFHNLERAFVEGVQDDFGSFSDCWQITEAAHAG